PATAGGCASRCRRRRRPSAAAAGWRRTTRWSGSSWRTRRTRTRSERAERRRRGAGDLAGGGGDVVAWQAPATFGGWRLPPCSPRFGPSEHADRGPVSVILLPGSPTMTVLRPAGTHLSAGRP